MQQLTLGDHNNTVSFLKRLLSENGYPLDLSKEFDDNTYHIVKEFQADLALVNDGIVGIRTWDKILRKGYNFNLDARNFFLESDEWFDQYIKKDTIYLHHTEGRHRPDYTIGWWENDNKPGKLTRVGTAFVFGSEALDGDSTFNGVTYRAFKEIYWSHHLGTKLNNNRLLNQKSIGIEICSLGPLHKTDADTYVFKNYNTEIEVPKSQVCELKKEWRGFKYFHKYTKKQIDECERLILTLSNFFNTPFISINYESSLLKVNLKL